MISRHSSVHPPPFTSLALSEILSRCFQLQFVEHLIRSGLNNRILLSDLASFIASSSHLSLYDCKMTVWAPGITFTQLNPKEEKTISLWVSLFFKEENLFLEATNPLQQNSPNFLLAGVVTSLPLKLSLARRMTLS